MKKEEKHKSATQIIEEVANEVCDKLCKYRQTSDDECICDYIRENGDCPLGKLY